MTQCMASFFLTPTGPIQGFWTPAIARNSPHALRSGVQKAPRHEVAGSWAPAGSERYGDLMPALTSTVGATLAGCELHVCTQGRSEARDRHLGGGSERIHGRSAH